MTELTRHNSDRTRAFHRKTAKRGSAWTVPARRGRRHEARWLSMVAAFQEHVWRSRLVFSAFRMHAYGSVDGDEPRASILTQTFRGELMAGATYGTSRREISVLTNQVRLSSLTPPVNAMLPAGTLPSPFLAVLTPILVALLLPKIYCKLLAVRRQPLLNSTVDSGCINQGASASEDCEGKILSNR